jgi:hypothetical protein
MTVPQEVKLARHAGDLDDDGHDTTGGADDQTAAEVPFTPTGTIAATDVQAAIAEVATDAAAALATHAALPTTSGGEILISDTPSTPLVFADLVQNDAQTDLVYTG